MYRRRLDLLISSAGLIVTVVLLALGGLLIWGNTFVDNQVHEQLAAQKIFFPPKGSPAIKGPQFAAMRQYAGQQLTTGPQAQTYANDFIAVHLSEVAGVLLVLAALGFVHARRVSADVAPPRSLGERIEPQEAKAA